MASVNYSNGEMEKVKMKKKTPDDFIHFLHGSDPLRLELNRLENELRDKDRELGDAQAEIKALKYSDRLKEKAVEELADELNKVDEKLKVNEALLESKVLFVVVIVACGKISLDILF